MKTQATKIDHLTWHYRGFVIHRNYKSEHGTGRVCQSQRGCRATPDIGWKPSIASAVEYIDLLHEKHAAGTLSRQGRAIVEAAIRQAAERGESIAKPKVESLIRLPVAFFVDHEERDCDTPKVVRETKSHFYVSADDPALAELLDDAEHYAHPSGPDAEGLGGLKASARATVRAIRDVIGWDDAEPEIRRLKRTVS